MRTQRFAIVCIALFCGAVTVAADAQPAEGQRRSRGRPSPAEVQELFDRYALAQAREVLRLSGAQSSDFESRMKQLHETRRRNHQERVRLLRELGQTLSKAESDERQLRGALRSLEQHDAKAAAELKSAYAAVDEVLDLRQRARFRLLEERLEQRKFDLLMRARQQNRPGMRRPN